eukprot:tig00000923_g5477.t1
MAHLVDSGYGACTPGRAREPSVRRGERRGAGRAGGTDGPGPPCSGAPPHEAPGALGSPGGPAAEGLALAGKRIQRGRSKRGPLSPATGAAPGRAALNLAMDAPPPLAPPPPQGIGRLPVPTDVPAPGLARPLPRVPPPSRRPEAHQAIRSGDGAPRPGAEAWAG